MKLIIKSIIAAIALTTGAAAFALVQTPAALTTNIDSGTQGEAINLEGIDPYYCPYVSMSQSWQPGGELIFSDSPESPTTTGILYEDASQPANVTNRIFAYHVNNNSSEHMRFSVLLVNLGSTSGTFRIQQSGISGPTTSYAYCGQLAFDRWLNSGQGPTVSVPSGGTIRIDTNFDSTLVAQGYLMNGIWDYSFTQPHEIVICAINPNDNPITQWPNLSVLARDTHERGTYEGCNKTYNNVTNIDTTNGIVYYSIGATNLDYPATGYDYAVYPPTSENHNDPSGILYRTHLTMSSSDGRALAILLNPRGGAWEGAVYAQSGLLSGGKFLVPSSGDISSQSDAAIEGDYQPNGSTEFMQFMPTGGSNFPVDVTLVPHD